MGDSLGRTKKLGSGLQIFRGHGRFLVVVAVLLWKSHMQVYLADSSGNVISE